MSAQRYTARSRNERFALLGKLLLGVEAIQGKSALATLRDIDRLDHRGVWLILAVMTGVLPTSEEVIGWYRRCRLDGPEALLRHASSAKRARGPVTVLVGGTVVDVHHTAVNDIATGIQRVVRNVLQRWESRELELVRWGRGYTRLHADVRDAFRVGTRSVPRRETLVPWQSTYLLPELALEEPRLARIQALASFSGNSTGAIGFDCVPVTSAETTGPGMSAAFSRQLAAIAQMDRVATISEAAATEFLGWRAMMASAGLTGPEIVPIPLPIEALPKPEQPVDLSAELGLGPHPLVVCIGSHEPRKNHLAVLHAAEMLWREGVEFELVFFGGNSWNSERFAERLAELQAKGHPVSSRKHVADSVVSAALARAAFSVFPSLNEGYGLPVAESLAAGTPVITSRFGSMSEIAASGGALLIDPRNDNELIAAMRRLLTDPAERERLIEVAKPAAGRNWGAYADQLWSFLVR